MPVSLKKKMMNSDDFGLRGPVIQKNKNKNEEPYDTSNLRKTALDEKKNEPAPPDELVHGLLDIQQQNHHIAKEKK